MTPQQGDILTLPERGTFSCCVDTRRQQFSFWQSGCFCEKPLVFWVGFRFYDSVGFLNDLIECVGRTCAGLADKRRGKNAQFSMRDIGLAAFSPFFMQCPSFLSHQRQMCAGIGHGRSNCQTLLGMEHIPSDNHIRAMLDDVEPSSLFEPFDDALAALETAGALPSLTSLGGHTLIALARLCAF